MIKNMIKYILLIFAILLGYSGTITAKEHIEFDGFYIGQPFWEVYSNFKRITNDNTIPNTIYFGSVRTGIYPVFDKDLNLILVKIDPLVYINTFDLFDFNKVEYFVESLVNKIGKDRFKIFDSDINGIKYKKYVLEDDNSILSFILSNKQVPSLDAIQGTSPEFISPIILEKKLSPIGPVVNGIRLGMSIPESKKMLASKNYPYNIIMSKMFTISDNTTYLNNFIYESPFIPLCFGVEKVDNSFIDKFIEAYKINVKHIQNETFVNQTGFDSKTNLYGNVNILDSNIKIYEGDGYYIIFKLYSEGTRDNGMVSVIYKDFVKFTPPPLPPHNNAPTFN